MFLTVKINVNNASQHAILGKLNTIEVMELDQRFTPFTDREVQRMYFL